MEEDQQYRCTLSNVPMMMNAYSQHFGFGLVCSDVNHRYFSDPCRPPREAPADLPHLPPPAACGEPTGRERRPHHPGLLQETVHPRRGARSEDHHESFRAGFSATWHSDHSALTTWGFSLCGIRHFPTALLYIRGCSREKQLCGVHGPGVSGGTDRKRHLPAADAWPWHPGNKDNQDSRRSSDKLTLKPFKNFPDRRTQDSMRLLQRCKCEALVGNWLLCRQRDTVMSSAH